MARESSAIAKSDAKKPAKKSAKRARGLKLDKKTFLQWFTPVKLYPEEPTPDYFDIGDIVKRFNEVTGAKKRVNNYCISPSTKKEIEKWLQLMPKNLGISLLSSGEKSEGVHGKSSPKMHRVLMPHFLMWLGKGQSINISGWWGLYGHLSTVQKPPPRMKLEDWEARVRSQSAEARKLYCKVLDDWFRANPDKSKAPHVGIFIKTRDGQITKGLWDLTIAGVQKALGIYLPKEVGSKKRQQINIRDYLQIPNLDQLMETEKYVVVLVRAGHTPKEAAPTAASSVREINPTPLLTAELEPLALPC